jgi:hypothetical protein
MLRYMTIHRKRGKEGMEGGGILPGFEGIGVHDCWKGYWAYRCEHGLCNAHVLRELTEGVIERTGQEWARGMTIRNERGGRMVSGEA